MGRRKDGGVKVSLFSFLSILAALIGALVVIIAGMAIIQLNKADGVEPEEVERAKQHIVLEGELEDMNGELRKLKLDIEKYIDDQKAQKEMLEERQQLQALLDNEDMVEEEESTLTNRINQLVSSNETLEKEHPPILERIEKATKEIEERGAAPEKPAVQIIRTGGGEGISYFVEITSVKSLVLHGAGEPHEILMSNVNGSKPFQHLLEIIGERPELHRLVVLIRPSPEASSSFGTLEKTIENYITQHDGKRLSVAKLPIPGEGKVDLSAYSRFTRPWTIPEELLKAGGSKGKGKGKGGKAKA